MKWIPPTLIVTGILLFWVAAHVDRSASFEDGSFLGMILLMLCGGVLAGVGVIWLLILVLVAI